MTHIKVDYIPSKWHAIWLFPRSDSIFERIQIWEWQYDSV